MNKDLMNRYVYAVVRQLPKKMQSDVEQELTGLIDDMLDSRCPDGMATEKDLRAVLTELGNPDELAAGYKGDAPRALIGPKYMPTYLLVLKIVLGSVLLGLVVAGVVQLFRGEGDVLSWFGMVFMGLTQAFAFVTVLFAIFEWRNVEMDVDGGLDSLPAVPEQNEAISKSSCYISIVATTLFMLILLVFPEISLFVNGQPVGLVDANAIRGLWWAVVLLGTLEIGMDIFRLHEGRHTLRLGIAGAVASLLQLALLAILFLPDGRVNGAFVVQTIEIFSPGALTGTVRDVLSQFHLIIFAIVVIIATIDVVSGIYNGLKYSHRR